jgi:hypothetical protein
VEKTSNVLVVVDNAVGQFFNVHYMLKLSRSPNRWWNKPLVEHGDEHLPAELVILRRSLRAGEEGAWMNSRGRSSGVIGLKPMPDGKLKTVRRDLPAFVAQALAKVYAKSRLLRGCPDLVIWHVGSQRVRFIEVKCLHKDRPSSQQIEFMRVAVLGGVPTEVVEWEFAGTGMKQPHV